MASLLDQKIKAKRDTKKPPGRLEDVALVFLLLTFILYYINSLFITFILLLLMTKGLNKSG